MKFLLTSLLKVEGERGSYVLANAAARCWTAYAVVGMLQFEPLLLAVQTLLAAAVQLF